MHPMKVPGHKIWLIITIRVVKLPNHSFTRVNLCWAS